MIWYDANVFLYATSYTVAWVNSISISFKLSMPHHSESRFYIFSF